MHLGMSVRRFIFACFADNSAQTVLFAALALVPLVGFVGLGIDTAQLVMWKRELRNAADIGAEAGASAKLSSSYVTSLDVSPFVRKAVGYNVSGNVVIKAIEGEPTSGPGISDPYAVRVVLSSTHEMPFMSIFTNRTVQLQAEATASSFNGSSFCMVALDGTAAGALTIAGSASLSMNCGAASNSKAAGSIYAAGQYIDVPDLYTAGTVNSGGGLSSNVTIANKMFALPDPMSNLPVPAPNCTGASAWWTKNNYTQIISPGCYTSIRSSGNLTLSPGVYYINGGDFQVDGSAMVAGSDVTLVFINSSNSKTPGKFSSAGTSTVQLSASTSGPYAGVLMYQDRSASYSNQTTFTLTGTSNSTYQGAVYAKGSMVKFTGTSGMSTACFQIAARYITLSGNTSVSNNCPTGSGAGAFNGKTVRLLG